MLEPSSETFTSAAFQTARSDFLDRFADIEARIASMLKAKGDCLKSTSFATRLEQFRKLSGIPQIANSNKPQLDVIADSITDLLQVRADIVHSRMTILNVGDQPFAKFVNAQHRHHQCPACRLISLADFSALTDRLANIHEKIVSLCQKSNPPSEPPTPSPDPAGGP